MKNYLIIGVILVVLIFAFLYMQNQNNKNQEALASQLVNHNSLQQESNKNSLLDFAAIMIPSLLDKYKENKKEREEEKKKEQNSVKSNPATFTGPYNPDYTQIPFKG